VIADANGAYRFDNLDVGSENSPTELILTAQCDKFQAQTKSIEIFCGAKSRCRVSGTIVIEKATERLATQPSSSSTASSARLSLRTPDASRERLFPGTYDVGETPWRLAAARGHLQRRTRRATEEGLVSIEVGPARQPLHVHERQARHDHHQEGNPSRGDPAAFEFFGPEEDSFTLAMASPTRSRPDPRQLLISEELNGPWEVEDVTATTTIQASTRRPLRAT
jgi:hypothetical protein